MLVDRRDILFGHGSPSEIAALLLVLTNMTFDGSKKRMVTSMRSDGVQRSGVLGWRPQLKGFRLPPQQNLKQE